MFEKKRALQPDEIDAIRGGLSQTLGIVLPQVVIKHRRRQRGLAQYEKLAARTPSFTVGERGLRFEVNLGSYLDTGLFLDHRDTRQMVRERAQDKVFLNLFAYTGSFTVYAAAGGAAAASPSTCRTPTRRGADATWCATAWRRRSGTVSFRRMFSVHRAHAPGAPGLT